MTMASGDQAAVLQMTRLVEARAAEEAQSLRDAEAVKRIKALCGRYADQCDLTPGAYIAGLREALREVLTDGASRGRGFGWSLIGDVAMRPTAWAIAGVAEKDSLVSVFGDPGSGKSFLAVDWACAIASGLPWQGRAVCQGLVLFIAGEGRNGLKRRFVAWGVQNGVDANRLPVALSTTAASLCDPEGLGPVLTSIEDIAQAHGAPVAIFIDTVARNFGPGNEDSTQDMTAFVAAADRLRELFGSLIVLIHHSGHGDKARSRGNSSLRGALDAEYRLKKAGAAVVLECLKSKDHDPPEEIALRICSVELPEVGEDGEPETSAVVVAADPGQEGAETGFCAGRGLGPRQAEVLEALQRLSAEAADGWVSQDLWSSEVRKNGMTKGAFYQARKSLLSRGHVAVLEGRAKPKEVGL